MTTKYALDDVALVKNRYGVWNRCIRSIHPERFADAWRPGHVDTFYHDDEVLEVRPLVVIDPEDEVQVQRLHDLFEAKWLAEHPRQHSAYSCNSGTCRTDVFQAALREFANPTPPVEEPAGIGAVVQASTVAGGNRQLFVSHQPYTPNDLSRWVDADGDWRGWVNLHDVTVLSEGYTPEAKS